MKRQYIMLATLCTLSSALFAVMTDKEVKRRVENIAETMHSGHVLAFTNDNLYTEALKLGMWNGAMILMKEFVEQVIEENKGEWLGMRSSTLTNALAAITDAEPKLITAIKVTRGVLNSPSDLARQIATLQKITADMLNVEKTLEANRYTGAKEEARKLLSSTSIFIGDTAKKAVRDAQKK